jgi:ribosome-interacting GTPase 1
MPANLTPEYQRAEQRYRQAKTYEEKLLALEEMLRTIPKHKGTDKMQAELKRKIANLRKAKPTRAGKAHQDIFYVPPQGGGQIVLLGTPNVGKSSIVAALTKAKVRVTDYPFGTALPVPGMTHYQDVPIQLVDTPPITAEQSPPGMMGTIRNCDALLIVADGGSESVLEEVEVCVKLLADRGLAPTSVPQPAVPTDPDQPEPIRCLLLVNKCDLPQAADNVQVLRDLYGDRIEVLAVSCKTGENLHELPKRLYELLGILRVYAKPPGKPPDMNEPFMLPIGSTIEDLARHIHRELASKLRSARIWGDGVYAGQHVKHDHVLRDRDVVELHGL